jgi:polyribonucleotide 5'-hydroxyl-kinase
MRRVSGGYGRLLMVANMSGLFVDTSSAFINGILGTKKDDPKARWTLVEQAVEVFESK